MSHKNVLYSKVSLEAVNKPFYGFSQYMYLCNSVEVVKKKCRSGKCLIHCRSDTLSTSARPIV